MWLLENPDDAFGGKRLWLRPGKLYLFGRTVAESGQVAISDKTISRKHLTIKVDEVPDGGGQNALGRSKVTIEDLNTKIGTLVNGEQIRRTKLTVTEDDNRLKLGSCNKLFRLFWHPVVLSFSFTNKELALDPWVKLREDLEQLDIKFLADYDMRWTSHVVSKKRNTPKGLRALINGKYIVTDTFVNAIATAAGTEGTEKSALELDFDGNWPDAVQHLPPRGEEPTSRPVEAYAPDERRAEIFDGYTFVFYDRKQYDNLFPVITNGKGKALLKEAVPHETQIDDFVRYVKSVAGEKGMGSFDDGSEGKGVVVVRHIPSKGATVDWFIEFTNAVSQRLDHRLIEQNEYLDAILASDASSLRRPLQPADRSEQPGSNRDGTGMDLDPPREVPAPDAPAADATTEGLDPPPVIQVRKRRAAQSRFKGFDVGGEDEEPFSVAPETNTSNGMENGRPSRKRAPSLPLEEADPGRLMDEIAPTATAAKRRRIAAGQDAVPRRSPSPIVEEDGADEELAELAPAKGRGRGSKTISKAAAAKKDDAQELLEMARRQREEAEVKRKAEEEAEAERDEGEVDWAAIRKLHIVEDMKIRQPPPPVAERTREQDIADGRWDPKWNGRRNFKRFRRQGEQQGRPIARVIVSLEEVKTKAYGIGDEYWLEDESVEKERRRRDKQRDSQTQASISQAGRSISQNDRTNARGKQPASEPVVLDDSFSSEDNGDDTPATAREASRAQPEEDLPRTKVAKAAEKANARRGQTQSQLPATQTHTRSTRATQKRAAPESPAGNPAKRPRRGLLEVHGSDESDDGETKFRFGRR